MITPSREFVKGLPKIFLLLAGRDKIEVTASLPVSTVEDVALNTPFNLWFITKKPEVLNHSKPLW
jgi:hypothetical protein